MRIIGWTVLATCLATSAVAQDDGLPGPRCYRKTTVAATYEATQRLLRKARLVHEESSNGQILMKHFPAIYIEEKVLLSPEYVLLQEVGCTRRILRKAEQLPTSECLETRGCEELPPVPLSPRP